MKFGISTASLYPDLTENAIEWLVNNNVENIEIFLNSTSEMSPEYIKKIKSVISGSKTKVASIHPFTSSIEPFMFFTQYERRFYDVLDFYKRYFSVMNELDAKYLVFHGNSKQSQIPNQLYFERFAVLMEKAREFGVEAAQENVSRCQSHGIEFISDMKKYFNNDVNFVLDVKQCVRGNVSPFDMLETMGANVKHVHISDNNREYDCLPPGKGDFNFEKFLQILQKNNFNGAILIELYRNNYSKKSELIKALGILKDKSQDIVLDNVNNNI